MRWPKRYDPANLLLYLRTARGLSQREMARACGLTCNDVCQFELGCRTLRYGKLSRLAGFFHVTAHALYYNDFSAVVGRPPGRYKRDTTCRDQLHRRQRRCEEIGDAGEMWVVQREVDKLRNTPFEGMVNSGYAQEGKAHFDILSFDAEHGNPIVIEVKTTTGDEEAIYLTKGELRLLRQCAEEGIPYQLHRVYRIDDPSRRGERVYTAQEVLELFDAVPNGYILRKRRKME